MVHYNGPTIDDENPLYCPSLSAAAFLEMVHQNLGSGPIAASTPHGQLPSFTKLLDHSLDEQDILDLLYRPLSGSEGSNSFSSSRSIPAWERSTPLRARERQVTPHSPPELRIKRKREPSPDSFSDLLGVPRHGRSFVAEDSTFYLSAKADKLRYFAGGADAFSPYDRRLRGRYLGQLTWGEMERKIVDLEDELYGPPVGTESPRGVDVLVTRLDELLPGTRLRDRLYALGVLSHQHIADFLARDGHLSARVLNMLRMSEIAKLDLTASITDEDGLNIAARDLLHVFAKPNSFVFLAEISLSGAQLDDFDLTSIHHLPRLACLWISNTGIGNEAIYHLVALKRTLVELDIALNPRIDDDVIPALLALSKLEFLSLFDTGVRMPGLRRLAQSLRAQKKTDFDIEVPRECEQYIDTLHRKYMLHPRPPLIVDPDACAQLSTAALRRNLEEHAAFNADILAEGSQKEMVVRLEHILRLRESDLAVRDIVWGTLERTTGREDSVESS
ncbi:hypothetical protein B0H21DRAFT_230902 [Amylocystis lapponica]|nr:hypothetical protein B0H21DRAFT_230902 [Amylocystis lapponica]